ncbi:leucine-rich repeat extensin-like protein 5 isoform X2 [Pseudomyrmex gracilis]|uniref:leucine-rich repeat extensin-like protein 5 isoform X2 n=1 Tax=Pseudomyrmex gracilis TaxID=219809 RepID=UPI000994B4DE|nr:leucine-rich repeat extensin-like protein 5 isoform X2 [Pseudomyrmex gracilis]
MRANVTLFFVVLALGLADAARRRVRSTTAKVTTTSSPFVGRQLGFAGQPEDTLWDNYDIQKLDSRSEIWKNPNDTLNHQEVIFGRQYPGLPINPGDTNELPSPISPQPSPPPQKLPPGCLGSRGQYSSLKSCADYLNCWDDVVVEQTCPAGLLFNDITNVCDFPYNVKCGERPPATPKPSLPAGSKLCPDPNGRYRSSTNCSEFYVCVAGKPCKFSCPRGLVYSDMGICDYTYNVDCQGTATPEPTQLPSTQPPWQSPSDLPSPLPTYAPQPLPSNLPPAYGPQPSRPPSRPPTKPSQPPTKPPKPPTKPPQPSTKPPQPPSKPPQPSSKPTRPPSIPTRPSAKPTQLPSKPPAYAPPPQPPSYAPQQPSYAPQPQPPSYHPQPNPPPPPPPYSGNPWLTKIETDPFHQQPVASQLEIDQTRKQAEISVNEGQPLDNLSAQNATETPTLTNPWTFFQVIPPELMNTPCNDGDLHRLNDSCTSVVVCRNNKLQVVRCLLGFSYDRPTDSCRPISVAKC